jgi:PIN domain nuclease of toxin-antitoxin system
MVARSPRALAATPLSLRSEHLSELCELKPVHQHPFGRALIAQAMAEDLALLTTDGQIPLCASNRLRVVCG